MSEQDIIIGGPTSYIPGSKPFTCENCGAEVQLAPSSQVLREERNLQVLCVRCGLTHASQYPGGGLPLTPEQIEEIAASVTAPKPGMWSW